MAENKEATPDETTLYNELVALLNQVNAVHTQMLRVDTQTTVMLWKLPKFRRTVGPQCVCLDSDPSRKQMTEELQKTKIAVRQYMEKWGHLLSELK